MNPRGSDGHWLVLIGGEGNNPPRSHHNVDRRMFISLPDYEAAFPRAFLPPKAQCWRALSLSLCAPWFVLTARFDDSKDFVNTFILSSDQDVVATIETLQGELTSLLCMHPRVVDECILWQGHAIHEVWMATSSDDPDCEVPLFAGEDGFEISGLFGERTDSLTRTTLLAKPSGPHAHHGGGVS